MKYNFYAVKDTLTNIYRQPTLMMSDEEATRQFKSNVNNIPLWKDNPSDFELWNLGEFDETTGEIWYKPNKITNGRAVLE